MMKPLIAAALLFVPATAMSQTTPAPAPAADPIATIYDKALGSGWQNWSWAKTELSVDIGNARMPIKVEAQGYQALFLHHAPFSAAPYRGISMMIQAVGGEAEVRVIGIANGKPIADTAKPGADGQPGLKARVIKVVPGGWTRVLIPFDELGIAKDMTIEGFWVQNNKGEPAPNLYVADIMLKN